MRYRRQQLVSEVGSQGQIALLKARVLCVGMGGLGNPAALYLAGAGIGTLGLIDEDTVSISNLHRQILFSTVECGEKKVLAAKRRLLALNPDLKIETYDFELDSRNVTEIFSKYDLILDGTDRFSTKLLINDACLKLQLPWIYATVSQWDGQTALFDGSSKLSPCYRCFQPDLPKIPIHNCAESGVIGPVVGILGTEQALQAMQVLLGLASDHIGKLKIFDGLHHSWMKVKIAKNPNCTACSKLPHEIELVDQKDPACEISDTFQITSKELTKLKAEGKMDFTLIDVRERHEWDEFHLEGAIHHPLGRLEKRDMPTLAPEAKILVYCQGGIRSAKAAKLLNAAGFQSVTELKNGLSEWVFP
jgi:molybdopterin/thiamine biosynthesis adenylyltransferase/rhodanese-related sulfurtransferase